MTRKKSTLGRRQFLQGVGIALSSASLPVFALNKNSQTESIRIADRKPNIFYICVDDLGSQLNCYGNPEVISPHFDAFARDSVLFEQAHCQSIGRHHFPINLRSNI